MWESMTPFQCSGELPKEKKVEEVSGFNLSTDWSAQDKLERKGLQTEVEVGT